LNYPQHNILNKDCDKSSNLIYDLIIDLLHTKMGCLFLLIVSKISLRIILLTKNFSELYIYNIVMG